MIKQLGVQEQERLEKILERTPIIALVDRAVTAAGGTLYLVGGLVRDLFRADVQDRDTPVDIDVEVHGISLDCLYGILAAYGTVCMVGVSFGVLRLSTAPGIDWSLPRIDAAGRHPQVTLVPTLSLTEALRRRDLTMNAMAIHLAEGTLYDPFNGIGDMHAGILRTPDPAFFVQDPLRLYRVMQAVSRFEMYPDHLLTELCTGIDATGVSPERIAAEFHKALFRSARPSLGIRWLASIYRLSEVLPELAATQGILQDPIWHPEGDVFEHTMQALDAAAGLLYPTDHDRQLIIYGALCHDLGKVAVTRVMDTRIRSIGHDEAGVVPTRTLLRRLMVQQRTIKAVALLVKHHMKPLWYVQDGSAAPSYKRLAADVAPLVNLYQLAQLARADKAARNPQRGAPLADALPAIETFITRASSYGVLYRPEPPLLRGADLMSLGITGAACGAWLRKAYALQIAESIPDRLQLLQRIIGQAQ